MILNRDASALPLNLKQIVNEKCLLLPRALTEVSRATAQSPLGTKTKFSTSKVLNDFEETVKKAEDALPSKDKNVNSLRK